jgi:hypothetical protein
LEAKRIGGQSQDETIKRGVIEELDSLDAQDQRKVLNFTHALAVRKHSPEKGGAILALASAFSPDDLAEMKRAIEEECEHVDEGS